MAIRQQAQALPMSCSPDDVTRGLPAASNLTLRATRGIRLVHSALPQSGQIIRLNNNLDAGESGGGTGSLLLWNEHGLSFDPRQMREAALGSLPWLSSAHWVLGSTLEGGRKSLIRRASVRNIGRQDYDSSREFERHRPERMSLRPGRDMAPECLVGGALLHNRGASFVNAPGTRRNTSAVGPPFHPFRGMFRVLSVGTCGTVHAYRVRALGKIRRRGRWRSWRRGRAASGRRNAASAGGRDFPSKESFVGQGEAGPGAKTRSDLKDRVGGRRHELVAGDAFLAGEPPTPFGQDSWRGRKNGVYEWLYRSMQAGIKDASIMSPLSSVHRMQH